MSMSEKILHLGKPDKNQGIVWKSSSMKIIFEEADRVARFNVPVLILGETGTGKNLLAKYIHRKSPRREGPFGKISLLNIPFDLFDSIFLGSEKGSYTGAYRKKTGFLEQHSEGTVFLDEIGDLPLEIQPKLLSILEDKQFFRLGGSGNIKIDVRFILATNKNLEELKKGGSFREDLFYRVSSFVLRIPPLRERREDILVLANHFLQKFRMENEIDQKVGFSGEAEDILIHYAWPGNVRELKNVVETSLIRSRGDRILPEDMDFFQESPAPAPSIEGNIFPDSEKRCFPSLLEKKEKKALLEALEKSLWIQKDAASLLGISPRTMHYKINKFGITHRRWYKNRAGRVETKTPLAPARDFAEPDRETLLATLVKCGWSQRETAKVLGITTRKIRSLIKKFGITHQNWPSHHYDD